MGKMVLETSKKMLAMRLDQRDIPRSQTWLGIPEPFETEDEALERMKYKGLDKHYAEFAKYHDKTNY